MGGAHCRGIDRLMSKGVLPKRRVVGVGLPSVAALTSTPTWRPLQATAIPPPAAAPSCFVVLRKCAIIPVLKPLHEEGFGNIGEVWIEFVQRLLPVGVREEIRRTHRAQATVPRVPALARLSRTL